MRLFCSNRRHDLKFQEMTNDDFEQIEVEWLLGAADELIARSIVVVKEAGYKICLLTNNGMYCRKITGKCSLLQISKFWCYSVTHHEKTSNVNKFCGALDSTSSYDNSKLSLHFDKN